MKKINIYRGAVWTIACCMLFGMTAGFVAPKSAHAAATAEIGTAWDNLSESDYVDGKVIVKFKKRLSANGFMSMASFESTAERAGIDLNRTQQMANGMALYETDKDVLATIAALQSDPRVEYVQPNLIYRPAAFPSGPPDDADWAQQWGMSLDLYGVDALGAWTHTTGSPDVIVTVIDTGVKYTHPDLVGQLTSLQGTNLARNDPYGKDQPMDTHNHGTHVSGIIAAAANNVIGVAGMAPDVRILPVKAQTDGEDYLDGYAIYGGIELAAERGAKIVNMSFGGSLFDLGMYELIRDHPDITFVAAAGNDAIEVNDENLVSPAIFTMDVVYRSTAYPALPNIVTVANLKNSGQLSASSNFGQNAVLLAAPGEAIRSTCAVGADYCQMTGTSMAAPFVSGAAALLYSLDDSLTPAEVIDLLVGQATPLATLSGKVKSGGTLNAAASVAHLANRVAPVTASSTNGAVAKGTSVTLATDSADAYISYTIDGSEPTEDNGTRYDGAIVVEAPITIKARAYADGKFHSETVEFAYTLLSEDANLGALSVSDGVLSPAFDETETAYEVTVENNVDEISVTAETSNANATLKINDATAASGMPYGPIPLDADNNTIEVTVTAEDGVTTQSYWITVIWTPPASDAALSALSVSDGVLSPVFDAAKTAYEVSVENNVDEISVTAETNDANATLKINDATAASGTPYGPISLDVGHNTIEAAVTAADGVTEQTYRITVNRAEAAGGGTPTDPGPPTTPTDPGPPATPTDPGPPATPTDPGPPATPTDPGPPATPTDPGPPATPTDPGPPATPTGPGAPLITSAAPPSDPLPSVGPGGTISAVPKFDSQTGVAAAAIGDAVLQEAIGSATIGNDGVKTVEIVIPAVEGARAYETTLPASSLTASGDGARLQLQTGVGTLTLPGNMLGARAAGDASDVTVSIGLTNASESGNESLRDLIGDRPIIRLELKVDGRSHAWSNEDATVTVSFPYAPSAEELADTEHLVIWYIDSAGNAIAVPSGRYDPSTGMMTFTVTHFSDYAIAYVHRSFADLGGVNWARKPIEVLASKGILNGTAANVFAPQAQVTRADFLVMLIRTLGLSASVDREANEAFDDVPSGVYYGQAVGIARKLGIVSGTGHNLFRPGEPISRQDMFVMTSKALNIARGGVAVTLPSVLNKFSDAGDIAPYARPAMTYLVQEGYVGGAQGKLNPRAQTTRAEAAVMLYRIYHMYRLQT